MRVSLADTGLTDLAVQGGTVAAVLVACAAATTGGTTATGTYLLLMLASECFRPVRDLSREWHAGHLGLSAVDGIAALRHAEGGVPDEGTAAADWATPPKYVSRTSTSPTRDGSDPPSQASPSPPRPDASPPWSAPPAPESPPC